VAALIEALAAVQDSRERLGRPRLTVQTMLEKPVMREIELLAPGLIDRCLAAAAGGQQSTATLQVMASCPQETEPLQQARSRPCARRSSSSKSTSSGSSRR
jgi:hypothetical protein